MSHSSNSNMNDPRQPLAAKPFKAPMVSPQDLPVDYSGFIAVVFGVAGVMFRVLIGASKYFCFYMVLGKMEFATQTRVLKGSRLFKLN